MQPPERDPNAPNPLPPPISTGFEAAPAPLPPPIPTTFEAAPAPAPFPIYNPSLDAPPLPPVVPIEAPRSEMVSRTPRWKWAMSLLLIGFYPVFVSLLGKIRPQHGGKSGPGLPSSVSGLVLYSLIELGIFGIFWALGWLFSRATKDELLLRWRGGIKPIWQGFLYAFALRLALIFVIIFVAGLYLTLSGTDPKQFAHFMEQNGPKTDALFPKGALSNPLYLLVLTTLLSFVVAGLREELWRNATLAALRHLFPSRWSDNARWISAIALSSIVFGLGHLYQGGMGVVFTSILGAGLGFVTWRHRSIWPSVFAHGFIDATSFLAAAAMAGKKVPLPAFWFGG